MKQQIQLRRREVDETADLPAELPPLLRRLYASRGVRSAQELERSVKGMLPWQQLSGVEKAVEILYNAFREGTRIIVVGDFDADGATSTALSVLAMRSLGCSNIDYLVPNRFEANTHFGTLAAGLGSFPFDCPTYLVQSDSHESSYWHSEFDILW